VEVGKRGLVVEGLVRQRMLEWAGRIFPQSVADQQVEKGVAMEEKEETEEEKKEVKEDEEEKAEEAGTYDSDSGCEEDNTQLALALALSLGESEAEEKEGPTKRQREHIPETEQKMQSNDVDIDIDIDIDIDKANGEIDSNVNANENANENANVSNMKATEGTHAQLEKHIAKNQVADEIVGRFPPTSSSSDSSNSNSNRDSSNFASCNGGSQDNAVQKRHHEPEEQREQLVYQPSRTQMLSLSLQAARSAALTLLRPHPLLNAHFFKVLRMDDSPLSLPGLSSHAPDEFWAALNWRGLHFVTFAPSSTEDSTRSRHRSRRSSDISSADTGKGVVDACHFQGQQLRLLLTLPFVGIYRWGASEVELWLDVRKPTEGGGSSMVRLRLATSVAVELCALMLEIINGILAEGRFKGVGGGGARQDR